ncbi:hypothetical protein FH972_010221 [Carpinus fangiana]|uniref:AB hydrolase-1 domain-containing protein n=1 Tax=Carpinus fangiana TaxID=176857 RepID=A0A660KQE1_9ROSI|nr:hypothetical protein FH972_010221 [Carpinus fangiana]
MGNITSLQHLNLQGTGIKKIPRSFKRLTSLVTLIISNCSRLEKIPKNLLSDMKCLTDFNARGSAIWIGSGPDPIKSLLLPNSLSSLSSLKELDLSYCNLSYEAIPSDLSCLLRLFSLRLSGNKFTRIPDSVAQLSSLVALELDDCSCLQVLPKLPLGLVRLSVRNCPSLEWLYKQMEIMLRTSNEKLRSNIDCSFVEAYIDYDGKPFKILHLHPRSPLWTESSDDKFHDFGPEVACGPALVGAGIPKWFNDKSTNSLGAIQLHSDLGFNKWCVLEGKGYAVFIVYEFHEPHATHPRKSRKRKVDEQKGNSNSTTFDGGNPNFPIFVCHFQVDGVDVEKPLVLCARGVPSVGPKGFWVLIPAWWFLQRITFLGGWRSLEASVTTSSLNVEVKECGARVVRDKHDAFELYQVLNTISPRDLDLQSYENPVYFMKGGLCARGPIIMKIKPKPKPTSLLPLPSAMIAPIAVALAVGFLGWAYQALKPPPPKICGSPDGPPITSPRVKLSDGRHLAYRESGVPKEEAKYKIIVVHGFDSSKDLGLPVPQELIEELKIYILFFDRVGYGDSDPYPSRSVKSEAFDIQELADQLQIGSKFYVIGISMGAYPIWSCLKYVPHRLSGASLVVPFVNHW